MTTKQARKRKGYNRTHDRIINWSMIRRAYIKMAKSGRMAAPPLPAALNAPKAFWGYEDDLPPLNKPPLVPLDNDRPGNDPDLVLMDEMAPMPVTLRDTEPMRDQYDELARYVEDLAKHYNITVSGNRIAGLVMSRVSDPGSPGSVLQLIDMSFDNADKRITRVRVFVDSITEADKPDYTIGTDKLGWVEAAIRGSA